MVDADLIKRKILLLEGKKRDLAAFPARNLLAFKKDVMLQKAVEKVLEEMVQICLDIGKHIVADEGMSLPDSNAGIFDVLKANGVISATTVSVMKKMIGFRNVLVHMYEKIDVESVYVNYTKRLSDFNVFSAEVAKYLGRRRKS